MALSLVVALKGSRMKIKDIMEGQIWQGFKQMGKGLGNVAGGVATAGVRALDKFGGGQGKVGTAAQQAAYAAAQKAKSKITARAGLPKQAAAEFMANLEQQGIDINDARSFDLETIRNYMQEFAMTFFAKGQGQGIEEYIRKASASIPVPGNINGKTVEQYFSRINQVRDDALNVVQYGAAGSDAGPSAPIGGKPAPGIALVNDYPVIISYNKKEYTIDDASGEWEDEKGAKVKSQYQVFLYKQADLLLPGDPSLNQAFDKYEATLSGAAAQPVEPAQQAAPAKPVRVKVGSETITKGADGRWYDEAGDFIDNPADIKELERRSASPTAGTYVK